MFHENLKRLRKARGLSQEELAVRLHVTRQTISKWENALSVPDAHLLIRLAELLEVSVGDLLGGPVDPPADQDRVAQQLEQLNTLLAQRNRRSRLIWRVVAGVLIAMVLSTILLLALSVAAYRDLSTQVQEPAIVEGTSFPLP